MKTSLNNFGKERQPSFSFSQRLQSELHMSPEQLDIVFESLDEDKNEYLTHDEFTEGFGECSQGSA